MYARGRGVAHSDSAAFSLYQAAASANSPEAQFRLARIYFEGRGTKKSEVDGLKWLKLAAAAGHADAAKELERRKD
jgi:TPR repeat protein